MLTPAAGSVARRISASQPSSMAKSSRPETARPATSDHAWLRRAILPSCVAGLRLFGRGLLAREIVLQRLDLRGSRWRQVERPDTPRNRAPEPDHIADLDRLRPPPLSPQRLRQQS